MSVPRERVFYDDGSDALEVSVSLPLPFIRLVLVVFDYAIESVSGINDDEQALLYGSLADMVEGANNAS